MGDREANTLSINNKNYLPLQEKLLFRRCMNVKLLYCHLENITFTLQSVISASNCAFMVWMLEVSLEKNKK